MYLANKSFICFISICCQSHRGGLLEELVDKIDKIQAQIILLLLKLRRTHTQKCPSANDKFVRAKKSTKRLRSGATACRHRNFCRFHKSTPFMSLSLFFKLFLGLAVLY